jgi:hypothetical protein
MMVNIRRRILSNLRVLFPKKCKLPTSIRMQVYFLGHANVHILNDKSDIIWNSTKLFLVSSMMFKYESVF